MIEKKLNLTAKTGMNSVSCSSKDREAAPKYTFEDLRCMFQTGRSYVKSGEGRNRVYGYRTGVMTKIGDIEISEWRSMMMALIEESGEMELQKQLKRWAENSCAWLHSKQEVEDYALELHSSRIFDNPEWVCYEEFNRNYRTKELKTDEE